ncbi:MAG TPA: hypothetical protein VJI13_02560 [Candidatus Norongarragalinales archaeon]|nr:hypothetical protein [Candidatus Norongarragalinales archaeon]
MAEKPKRPFGEKEMDSLIQGPPNSQHPVGRPVRGRDLMEDVLNGLRPDEIEKLKAALQRGKK